MAALRNLVLPFGALAGTRIILDGVEGKISLYDSTDAAVIVLDSATSAMTVSGADGSELDITAGAGSALITMLPPTEPGSPWTAGDFKTELYSEGMHTFPAASIYSPKDTVDGTSSSTQWHGGYVDNSVVRSAVINTADDAIFLVETMTVDSLTSDSASLKVNGFPVVQRIATWTETSDVSFTSAETTVNTVIFNAVAGCTYSIGFCCAFLSSVAGDTANVRIRNDDVSGSTIRVISLDLKPAFNTPCTVFTTWTASSTASKTFVVTGLRTAGTGTCRRIGSTLSPAILTVERIS
jgi:hypothetical protein